MADAGVCKIDGCDKSAFARGWCNSHWKRWRRHGDPLSGGTARGAPRAFLEKALIFTGDSCLLWPFGTNGHGYGALNVGDRMGGVHRLICIERHGPPPSIFHQAAHSCGVRGCCNPAHIRWATPAENMDDKWGHGTMMVGETHTNAKVTTEGVLTIKALRGLQTQEAIGERFGITPSAVCAIQNGRVRRQG